MWMGRSAQSRVTTWHDSRSLYLSLVCGALSSGHAATVRAHWSEHVPTFCHTGALPPQGAGPPSTPFPLPDTPGKCEHVCFLGLCPHRHRCPSCPLFQLRAPPPTGIPGSRSHVSPVCSALVYDRAFFLRARLQLQTWAAVGFCLRPSQTSESDAFPQALGQLLSSPPGVAVTQLSVVRFICHSLHSTHCAEHF